MSEKCVSPVQRTTYLGVVWDLTTMQTRMSPARIESILKSVKRVRESRSLTVKQFKKLLGLMSAASNVIPFGLLYMRPLQWWLKTKGFSSRGNPLRVIKVTRRCLRALDIRWSWMLWYRLGRGFVCTPFPDRSAHRSSREIAPVWGPSIAIHHSGQAEYFSDLISLTDGSPSGNPVGGISSHWQRAWSFTPVRSSGSCECGPWGGTSHSLWSLIWGCWDNPPI